MWGETGLGRLLDGEIGGQVGWLLPTALLLLVAGLLVHPPATRTDPVRASLVVWGGWLVVTAATFSFMAGIFHAYYTVALAPAIGALVGTGAWLLWRHRTSLVAAGVASAAVSLTAVLAFFLLGRTPDFLPWLRWVVLVAGLRGRARRSPGSAGCRARIAAGVAAAALVVSLAGPAAYAVETAATPHTGSIPSAGPAPRAAARAAGRPGGCRRAARPRARHRRRRRRRRRRTARRQRVHRRDHRAAAGRTPTTTPGSPRRSAPTPRPATSWPARSR